ncbi:MAG: hypothetical protein KatS3mg057_1815 [Herpetosiphonaceae bacterium]|nr:MAG: hypothetical protein KatS3mg057_1815 [Herpetosiphonaceae bacterium]
MVLEMWMIEVEMQFAAAAAIPARYEPETEYEGRSFISVPDDGVHARQAAREEGP